MIVTRYHTLLSVIIISLGLFTFSVNPANGQSSPSEELPAFDVGGILQQQFIADETPDSPTRFSIKRARLGVTGRLTDAISVNLIGGYTEPPNNTPRLVNAFIDFDLHPLFQVRSGKFLVPFGLEGPQPIPLNPAIERSAAVRTLNTFMMFRDVGVQISGSQPAFNYAVAVVNGAGANQIEQIEPKDLVGRVGLRVTDNVEVGISGHLGQYRPIPSSDNEESRYRAGIDINYKGDPVFARGEYIIREDERPSADPRSMNGGYLLGGFNVTSDLEAIARYNYVDRNTSIDDDHMTGVTLGANYYFVGNTRLSVNYQLRDDRLNDDLGNLLTVQMQVTL